MQIGRILKAHGVKGDIKVEPFLDGALFLTLKELYIGEKLYKIEKNRAADAFFLIKLEGVSDMNAAEALRGAVLTAPRDKLPAPKEGSHYISDIIGAKVYANEKLLGEVEEIFTHGAADVYSVAGEGGRIMFPSLKKLFINIDAENKKIVLDPEELKKVAVYEN